MSSRQKSSSKGSVPLSASPFATAVMAGADPKTPVQVVDAAGARSARRRSTKSMAVSPVSVPAAAPVSANAVIGSLTLSSPVRVPSPVRAVVPATPAEKVATAEEQLLSVGMVPTSVVIVRPGENHGMASAMYIEAVLPQPSGSRALVLLDNDAMVGADIQARATMVREGTPMVLENVAATVHPISAQRLSLLNVMPASIAGVGAVEAGRSVHAIHRGASSSLVRSPHGKTEEVVMTVEQAATATGFEKTAVLSSPHFNQDLYSSVHQTLPIVSMSRLMSAPKETLGDVARATEKIHRASEQVLSEEIKSLSMRANALTKSRAFSDTLASRESQLLGTFKKSLLSTQSKVGASLSQLSSLDNEFASLAHTSGSLTEENAAKSARVAANIESYNRIATVDLPNLTRAFLAKSAAALDASAKLIEEAEAKTTALFKELFKEQEELLEALKVNETVASRDLTSTR